VFTARSWKSRGDPATRLAAAIGTRIFDARIAAFIQSYRFLWSMNECMD
jgi:hypothetical protein